MKGITFRTKYDYLEIPAGTIVQGVALAGDRFFKGGMIGVSLTYEDHDHSFCAGFESSPVYGGWWYSSDSLKPLTQEARDFVAAHLAAGGV